MIIRVTASLGETRLHLAGMLDASGAAALREDLEAVVARGDDAIVLDLSVVTFLDGAGLGAIAFLHRRLALRGRRLRLAGAAGQPRAMLRDLGLGHLMAPGPARHGQAAPWSLRGLAQRPAG